MGIGKQSLWLKSAFSLILIALAWPAITNFPETLIQAHRFHLTDDEALHVEVIETLAQTSKYQNWDGNAFVPQLTTGPTVLGPAALLSAVSGLPGAVSGRVVVILSHLMTLLLVAWMAAESGKSTRTRLAFAIVGVGLFVSGWRGLQDTNYFAFGVLGEGAAVFYLLLCLYFLRRKWGFPAGVAATLAVFSKPYLMFLPLSVLIATRGARVRVLVGAALPAFIWFLWIASELGFNGAVQFTLNYPSIMRAANGAGLSGSVWEHLVALPVLLKWRSILFAAIGIWLWTRQDLKAWATRTVLLFVVVHSIWWMFLTPGPQARYLLPIVALEWLGFAVFAPSTLVTWLRNRWPALANFQTPPAGGLTLLLVIAAIGPISKNSKEWSVDRSDPRACGLCRQLTLQNFWRGLSARPRLWSTTQGYASDKDLVLSAPHDLSRAPLENLPREGWITLGENPVPGAEETLKSRCAPVFVVAGLNEGFWECR